MSKISSKLDFVLLSPCTIFALMKKMLTIIVAATLLPMLAAAQNLKVSLLTCFPGQEVFELYGHTAIRITDGESLDKTYNFGLFSFNKPHFVYRFVKGETDYAVGGYPTEYFTPEYAMRGSKVVEQTLNLTQQQAVWLYDELERLCLPENREYRYNYVLNNCATRPRDLIEKAVGGLSYPLPPFPDATYRDIMTHYAENYPWYQFGIDLALGEGIDRRLTVREQMFAPVILMKEMAGATFKDASGKSRHIVAATSTLVEGSESPVLPPTPLPLSPIFVCWAAFALIAVATYYKVVRHRQLRWVDTLWFTLTGLTGCLVFFLIFVSEHEATSPNWLGVWLNPLCLFPAVAIWIKSAKKWVYSYHFLNFALVLMLIAGWAALPQVANAAFFPLMLSSLALSASHIVNYKRCEKRSK